MVKSALGVELELALRHQTVGNNRKDGEIVLLRLSFGRKAWKNKFSFRHLFCVQCFEGGKKIVKIFTNIVARFMEKLIDKKLTT